MYPGLPSFPQYDLAQSQLSTGTSGKFVSGDMIFFQLDRRAEESDQTFFERTARWLNYVAEHSYPITLAVSLGTMKTLIEAPMLMTHSAFTPEQLAGYGIWKAGLRLAVGAEDANDIIADLDEALDKAA